MSGDELGPKGVADEPLRLERFLGELDRSLSELEGLEEWKGGDWKTAPGYRTHHMLGARHGSAAAKRCTCVLARTMHRLGYTNDDRAKPEGGYSRLYGFEWQKIDLVAATSPGPWGGCVWMGKYRLDLALEVENNPAEFTLHMRGLLDTNAMHRVCIFYTDRTDALDTEVGTGAGMIAARDWTWSLDASDVWAPPVTAKLVAVFVGLDPPRIVGAYAWATDAPGARPVACDWGRAR